MYLCEIILYKHLCTRSSIILTESRKWWNKLLSLNQVWLRSASTGWAWKRGRWHVERDRWSPRRLPNTDAWISAGVYTIAWAQSAVALMCQIRYLTGVWAGSSASFMTGFCRTGIYGTELCWMDRHHVPIILINISRSHFNAEKVRTYWKIILANKNVCLAPSCQNIVIVNIVL